MKKIALFIAIAVAVAACGKQEAPQTPTSPESSHKAPAAQAPSRQSPVPAPEDKRGVAALAAAGVKFDFPHQVLYDILDVSGSGTPRHRVLVEIQGGEFDQVVEQFGESLEALGYQKDSGKETGGRIDSVYSAEGKPTYYLLMQPAGMGPKLMGKDSTGSIHIMWNIPSRN
ncbi:hypothetical protein ACTJIL_12505 [Luteimonas sp. 22616]|uniref:hypothetical protein n=1 Tax=Luteimonas sp. 22616 TaxID=3453951 RepID=UPI003F839BD5